MSQETKDTLAVMIAFFVIMLFGFIAIMVTANIQKNDNEQTNVVEYEYSEEKEVKNEK